MYKSEENFNSNPKQFKDEYEDNIEKEEKNKDFDEENE